MRQLQGPWKTIVTIIAFIFAFFHLYTAGAGPLPDLMQRAVHVGLAVALVLAIKPATKREKGRNIPWWDILLIVFVIYACARIFFIYMRIAYNPGEAEGYDLVLGGILIIAVMETSRRTIGWVFTSLVLLGIGIVYFGPYLPGILHFRGHSLERIIAVLYVSFDGVFGSLTGISATLLAIYILFGSALLATGAGKTFIDLAVIIAGRFRGGPAKVAVVSSAFLGMINGSAMANVATTGSFTIPLMKRLGYRSEFAGGVESTASTGGMITPPIMGSGAFVMSELLSIPYATIAVRAIIPAFLYYTGTMAAVHFEALRLGLVPVPKDEMPPLRSIVNWARLGPLSVAILLLVGLLGIGFSPALACFIALAGMVLVFLFVDLRITNIKKRIVDLCRNFAEGGLEVAQVAPLLVCANIVVSLIGMGGLGVRLSGAIVDLGSNSLFLALLLSAVVVTILGMGIPVTAAYILGVAISAQALIQLGLQPFPVHMFALFYGTLGAITPPVCGACYVGAAIAKADWLKVAFIACRLGAIAFIVPFLFVTNPVLFGIGDPYVVAATFVVVVIGTVFMSSALFGYLDRRLSYFSRTLLLISALLLIVGAHMNWSWVGIGLVLPIPIVFHRFMPWVRAKVRKGD